MTTLPPLAPLPAAFATTRADLHCLAEHVIAPLRHREEGHIGLRPTPGGFGTETMPNDRVVRVLNGMLVDFSRDGERRDDITTLAEAGAFLRGPVGADPDIYAPTTDPDPTRRLQVDREAANALGALFTWGAVLLHAVRSADPADEASIAQIWPEHFDLAIDLGPEGQRVNVGVSPGDAEHPEPYLYVGPWDRSRLDDPVWNEPFGASLGYQEILAGADAREFISRARAAVPSPPPA